MLTDELEETRHRHRTGVILGILTVAMLASLAELVAFAPWIVGFVAALGAAAIWCAWLERHSA